MINYRVAYIALVLLAAFLVSCGSADPQAMQPDPSFDPDRLLEFGEGNFPGTDPEPFGRDWFQGGFHSAPVFSPDGSSVWWAGSYATQKVYVSHYTNGAWTDQEIVSFSDDINSYRDPFISPDGMKFYFISTAPLTEGDGSGKENIWMMEWVAGEWSDPRPLPEAVNNLQLHWTPSVASNYDLYFAASIDGNPDFFKAAFKDGTYSDPVPLGLPINTAELEFTPHIAPDQSYLLFSRAKDNTSPAHLFISFAHEGGWTEAVRVENVESCISPIVTPDQRYVIYLKDPSALEWRDTSFIEELKP